MALSSFLTINGFSLPCPAAGFQYTISTTVNAGRNANNVVVGQKVGRDLYKLESLKWIGLKPEVWEKILKSIEPFYVDVTFEDYRTGKPITIKMYPSDRKAKPLFVDKNTHKVIQYEECSFNLIDTGSE